MKTSLILVLLATVYMACSQTATNSPANSKQNSLKAGPVGGPCEGCEAIYENETPFEQLDWKLTLPDYEQHDPKLKITGTVYKRDGKTPAPDIVLYVYHTNSKGIYPTVGNEKGWERRHGYIRGWLKTNGKGQYEINTFKPGSYPTGGNPAHIHITIREPDKNEYWIDEYKFSGDPFLTEAAIANQSNVGGSGILTLTEAADGSLMGKRDIILGKNVANYPKE